MKLVFLSQRVPYPPDRGDRITTYHMLKHYLDRGATARVGCLSEEPRDREGIEQLESMVDEVCAPMIDRRWRKLVSLRGLVTGEALTLPFFRHRQLVRTVDRWLREDPPDVIHMYSVSMAQYVFAHRGARRVMQFAELDSDKWRQYAERRRGPGRWIYSREARLLLEFERAVARSFEACTVVSDVEKQLFMHHIPDVEPAILPNGVDVDHFVSAGDDRREPHTVIFTGVMDYEPNVDGVLWFCRECWPAVRAEFDDAKLLIVGSHPANEIRELDGKHGVIVTGRVPEIPTFADRAAVSIAPLRLARGVQNKVLEAMSMALPVVASPQASQGLGDVPSDTLIRVEGAAATTTAVIELLRDPAGARSIGQRAAAYVREHFHWRRMYEILDSVVDGAG